MAKREVIIIDSKIADKIIEIVKKSYPPHICGCFGSKCKECSDLDEILMRLNKRTKIIAESGNLDLDCEKIYVRNG